MLAFVLMAEELVLSLVFNSVEDIEITSKHVVMLPTFIVVAMPRPGLLSSLHHYLYR
jgi:hypothetical protein